MIEYPGGVVAIYDYDFADREVSLSMQDGTDSQIIAFSASYLSSGPLAGLVYGNGLTEIRTHTSRYFPMTIEVPNRLRWTYETDAMGNTTGMTKHGDPDSSRTFAYQDYQYFLTEGHGPWGSLLWAYDRSASRLTEVRNGVTTDYIYKPNAAEKNSPQLASSVTGESQTQYYYDRDGNLTHIRRNRTKVRYNYNAERHLSQIRSDRAGEPPALTNLRYDGRGYLTSSTLTRSSDGSMPDLTTRNTYSSSGALHHLGKAARLLCHGRRSNAIVMRASNGSGSTLLAGISSNA
jgi:YD repeat-containing protein